MYKLKFKVRGDNWVAEFLPEEEFMQRAERYDEYRGAAGITKPNSRRIIFDMGELTNVLVKHEVFHAFSSTLLIESANLCPDQIEEVNAELIAHYSKQMLTVSRLLYRAGRDYAKRLKRA